jgi:hypothetical protein
MKTKNVGLIISLIKTGLRLLALLSVLFLCQDLPAAVTFTITPSAVSNTYNGVITLQVAGLTSGSTVVVQKFLDLNTNGLIDGSDWLVQQFNMTDGQAGMAFGGVTNFNVPGDTDTTAGQITAKLNFQGGDFIQNIAGKFLFKVSGNFTPPITNVFTVTNFPYAQKFTGNVVSNNTSTVVSNAVVLLFSGPAAQSSPQAGAVANNAGTYTIPAPPGTYSLLAFRTNFLANMNTAPMLTLAASQTITTNLTLTNATASISGTNVDANNSSIRLPGVMVVAQSTNGQIAVTFTDTNGIFNVRITAGTWGIKADDTSLIVHGYLGLQNRTNVNAGATGVTIAVPKATALIYGSVKDNLGNPLTALDVYANDQNNNLYETDGYTDANGNYVLGVLGLGSSDPWWMEANGNNTLTNYVCSQETINGNINAGQAVLQNFTAIPAPNHITGNVKDSKGTNIVDVNVYAYTTIGGVNYNPEIDTDANGNYWLNVPNGSWNIAINCNGGDHSLDSILGSGNYACPNNQSATISGNNATNNFIVQLCGGISIVTSSPLPTGEVNAYYDQFFQASSCGNSFTWSFISGSPPPGLNGDPSSGEIFGTPTSSGTFTFTVQVTDGVNTTNKQFSLTISNALQITTTSLLNGTNNSTYSQTLQATGGLPFGGASPYSWSLASGSASLPANLTLATNGLLSGTLATSGLFNFTAEAADSLGVVYDQALSLNIVSTNTYPPLTVGLGGGQVIILWPASAGTNFTLQMTTNLATGPWVPATNGVLAVAFTFTNNPPAAFFRLQ